MNGAAPAPRTRHEAGDVHLHARQVRAVALVVLLAAAPAAADSPALGLQPIASGFDRPVCISNAGDGSGRVFLCEQNGLVRILEGGSVAQEPFLDVRGISSCCGERGLLSIAFPPGFATSGRFYVNYTDNGGDTVVSRFHVSNDDPDRADPDSEEVLLRVDQPYSNHNGGQLAFGPDGYLYIGMGDGGSGGDPGNRAQTPSSLLGKMLRIDVESGASPYAIPAGNPFAALTGYRPEIWALGLRNPWRFSFDRGTGDLWIADVGQGSWEEIDHQPASSGGGENYGWRLMEGTHCYGQQSCNSAGLVPPVVEYSHALGCSVSGGYVYRGAEFPRPLGSYVYGDYCSGRIWTLRRVDGTWAATEALDTSLSISAFGDDEGGELYVSDYGGGTIYRLVDDAPGCALGCTAAVPTSAPPGVAVELVGQGAASACSERLSYRWDFGDGSPAVSGASTLHVFGQSGEHVWRFSVESGTASCQASGVITVRSRLRRALRSPS